MNCVFDFLIGEERKPGENCKYVRSHILNNTREGLLQLGNDNAFYVDKYLLDLLF